MHNVCECLDRSVRRNARFPVHNHLNAILSGFLRCRPKKTRQGEFCRPEEPNRCKINTITPQQPMLHRRYAPLRRVIRQCVRNSVCRRFRPDVRSTIQSRRSGCDEPRPEAGQASPLILYFNDRIVAVAYRTGSSKYRTGPEAFRALLCHLHGYRPATFAGGAFDVILI